ncbi:MAG: T9SS type A sorting domain-containing protein [candidate division Zixibacteria bacterium]|nr:T9SS type A sorting domain-containing protein [candidate division Zixibacteria bacterium]
MNSQATIVFVTKHSLAALLILFGAAVLAGGASAKTIHVPAEYASIQQGIDAANSGDEVVVAPGIYSGPGNRDLDFAGKALTLRSSGGIETTIIDVEGSASEHHRALWFHSGETSLSVVDGFTIRNGLAIQGGGVLIVGASPTLQNMRFVNNVATMGSGGAAQIIVGANPVFTNTNFEGNSAELGCGGAVSVMGASVTITNCEFLSNRALAGGGLNLADGDGAVVTGSVFNGNSAAGGGGIFTERFSFSVTDVTFANNTAAKGGGIFSNGSVFTVDGSEFIENAATFGSGGGIQAIMNSRPTVLNSEFLRNSAEFGCGGGVSAMGASVTITNCGFFSNYALAGGGLNLAEGEGAVVTGSVFNGNSAAGGGGIFTERFSFSVTDVTFEKNTAGKGGGIFSNGSVFTVDGSEFIENSATAGSGGGIQAIMGSRPTVLNSDFRRNSANIGCGGGMSVDASIGTVKNTIFSENTALAGGGFNFVDESGSSLSNCSFVGNSAPGGGGIFCERSSPIIENIIIAFSSIGGAFVCSEASPQISCSDFYGNEGGPGDWGGHVTAQAGINGNFSADPMFCDDGSDTYALAPQSPCLSENSSCGETVGALSSGSCLPTDVDETGGAALPDHFSLDQNYPNPFNPTTRIPFNLAAKSDWTISIFNSLGQLIETFKGRSSAGVVEIDWDASNVSSGIYHYRINAGAFTASRKMVLLK